MSLALVLAGIVFLVSAVRDTQGDLFGYLKGDLTGQNNFLQWAVALILIGLIGYIPDAKGFSMALLALVLVAIFLRRGTGFFDQLTSATGLSVGGTEA